MPPSTADSRLGAHHKIVHALETRQKRLDLTSMNLEDLPAEISLLHDVEVLDLSGNHLSTLPDGLIGLRSLKRLFLTKNCFDTWPSEVSKLPALELLSLKSNALRVLPEMAKRPLDWKWLILTDNRLEGLPEHFGATLPQLRKLALANNQIRRLPESFKLLQDLELLRLSNNQLERLPPELRHLKRLTWVALGGNPYGEHHEGHRRAQADLKDLERSFADFRLETVLGSGASGVVYRTSSALEPDRWLAAKMFKEVSSDGNPADELIVSAAAASGPGTPEGVIPFRGWFERPHYGLLMDFLPNAEPLGLPPSLESITRDVYDPHLELSNGELIRILITLAKVQRHLASKQVVHGDFYAHNVLVTADRSPWLGDWGASFFYSNQDAFLEKVEVRAFGCLMEDLVARTPAGIDPDASVLMAACLHPEPEQRPVFSHIVAVLETLSPTGT